MAIIYYFETFIWRDILLCINIIFPKTFNMLRPITGIILKNLTSQWDVLWKILSMDRQNLQIYLFSAISNNLSHWLHYAAFSWYNSLKFVYKNRRKILSKTCKILVFEKKKKSLKISMFLYLSWAYWIIA